MAVLMIVVMVVLVVVVMFVLVGVVVTLMIFVIMVVFDHLAERDAEKGPGEPGTEADVEFAALGSEAMGTKDSPDSEGSVDEGPIVGVGLVDDAEPVQVASKAEPTVTDGIVNGSDQFLDFGVELILVIEKSADGNAGVEVVSEIESSGKLN